MEVSKEQVVKSMKNKCFFISLLLLISFCSSLILERNGLYIKLFPLYLLEQVCLLVLVTLLLCRKKENNEVAVDSLLVVIIVGLSAYSLLSDLLVKKDFRFAIIISVTIFTIMSLVCTYSNTKTLLVEAFANATQWFLFILVLLSLLTNKSFFVDRYSGPIENASVFALYLCSIWAVLLGIIEYKIKARKTDKQTVLTLMELAIVLAMILMSQSITPTIALVALTGICAIRILYHFTGKKGVIAFIICISIVVFITIAILSFAPSTSSINKIRIVEKLRAGDITTLLSLRDYYWRAYLRKMNLFGHAIKPYLWDHRILPHNSIIGVAYNYGVPIIVPYVLLFIISIEKAVQYSRSKQKYASIPLYSILGFFIMSMADNVEQPFVWLPWIACYLMMVPVMTRRYIQ